MPLWLINSGLILYNKIVENITYMKLIIIKIQNLKMYISPADINNSNTWKRNKIKIAIIYRFPDLFNIFLFLILVMIISYTTPAKV